MARAQTIEPESGSSTHWPITGSLGESAVLSSRCAQCPSVPWVPAVAMDGKEIRGVPKQTSD